MFSAHNRAIAAAHGIDIEDSYRRMLAEIHVGGSVVERLNDSMRGVSRSNPGKRDSGVSRPYLHSSRGLTLRESQALEQFAAGKRNRGVAEALGINHETVRTHTTRIRAKLEARNITHAVAIAIRSSLI